jgi:ParB/RepB/Spo0J family partition protein
MPKMEAQSMTIKISLCDIIETGNIREKEKYSPNEKGEYPKEIIDLAMSIKTVGQLQPINVKLAGEAEGRKQYEIIAGNRRYYAHKYLVSIGEDFNQITATITTGNKTVIQLIENIQREDLTAQEREAAIFQLSESGMKQKEIAAQLSKDAPFVSINISAYKIRKKGITAGIDLSGVETSTLSEFLAVPDDEIISLLGDLVRLGGTRVIAGVLAERFKNKKDAPLKILISGGDIPTRVLGKAGNDDENDPLMTGGEIPAEPTEPPKKTQGKAAPRINEPIEAEHREIDLNIVLTVIYDYIKDLEKNGIDGNDRALMINTAKNILALIHKAL